MLVTLKEILAIAEERQIAVGAFNAVSLESMQAIIEGAESLNVPVILQFAQCHEPLIPMSLIGPLMIEFAKKAAVPVCVHLDHGETIEFIEAALKLGFTGVMIDGSTLPYEKNTEVTKQVVSMAKAYGASVEAELGCMGRTESGAGDGTGAEDETKIYTDPFLAREFVAETGIDALACSFGTTHGIYLSQPKLDMSVVTGVREQTGGIPVVMHGGSGVSSEDFKTCIRSGVRKINYFTYMDKAGGQASKEYMNSLSEKDPLFFTRIQAAAREGMKQNVMEAMRTFALL